MPPKRRQASKAKKTPFENSKKKAAVEPEPLPDPEEHCQVGDCSEWTAVSLCEDCGVVLKCGECV
jgi:hypothetical protein